MKKLRTAIFAAMGLAGLQAHAAVIGLGFEDVTNSAAVVVGNFYNGGFGGSLGVSFSADATAVRAFTAGGTANFGNRYTGDPRTPLGAGNNALAFPGTASTGFDVTVTGGFTTALSFLYSNTVAFMVDVLGVGGTSVLAGATPAISALTNSQCTVFNLGDLGYEDGGYCGWSTFSLNLGNEPGFKVVFSGMGNTVLLDNLTFGSATPQGTTSPGGPGNQVPEPASLALVIAALGGAIAVSRRRRFPQAQPI